MNETRRIRTLTISDFFRLFVKKFWLIVLVTVVVVGAVLVQQSFFFTAKYESTATLYILKQENESSYTYTSSDFSLALDVVNDCTYILKSHAVLDEVINELDLDISYQTLYKSISTNNPSDTRILEVTVTTESAVLSKNIADKVCEIGITRITDAMGFEQVNLYENGLLSVEPSNSFSLLIYILIAAIAGAITYTATLILYIVDDRLSEKDEIEQIFGISVIGEIPHAGGSGKKGYKKYGYKKYGYGQNTRKGTGRNSRKQRSQGRE